MNAHTYIARTANRLPVRPISSREGSDHVPGDATPRSLEMFLSQNQHRYHPYLYHLADVPWAVMGTLTWASGGKRFGTWESEKLRREDFRMMLNLARRQLKCRGKDFGYYHAMEWGKAGECHFHFLMARQGLERVPDAKLAETLQRIWQGELHPTGETRVGAGLADVRPFDAEQQFNGVSYCLKREYDRQGQRERFDFPSPRLMRLLEQRTTPARFQNSFLLSRGQARRGTQISLSTAFGASAAHENDS